MRTVLNWFVLILVPMYLLAGCSDSDDDNDSKEQRDPAVSAYSGPTERVAISMKSVADKMVLDGIGVGVDMVNDLADTDVFLLIPRDDPPSGKGLLGTTVAVIEEVRRQNQNIATKASSINRLASSKAININDAHCGVGNDGGTLDYTGDVATEGELNDGDQITITFTDCVPGGTEKLNGKVDASFKKAPDENIRNYEVEATFSNFTISHEDDSGTVFRNQYVGTATISNSHTPNSMDKYTLASNALYGKLEGVEMLFTDMQVTTAQIANMLELEYTIASKDLGGSVAINTTTPIAFMQDLPNTGAVVVTGANDSKVRFTFSAGTINADYDFDGDDTYEDNGDVQLPDDG